MSTVKFYGNPTHFCAGKNCVFHLATNVDNKYLISTIGHYLVNGVLTKINVDTHYETMVFEIEGEDKYGNPNVIDWQGIDVVRMDDSKAAERIHYEMIGKYSDTFYNIVNFTI